MIIETSQGPVTIYVDEKYTKVGARVSGGADSAIMLYLLGLYKKMVRDIQVVPITVINAEKPWQHIFASRVVRFVENELSIEFCPHRVKPEHVDPMWYGEEQAEYNKDLRRDGIIECHFVGITLNPSENLDLYGEFFLDESRNRSEERKLEFSNHGYIPFANIDKRGVAELYHKFDLMDTLFPITRSCENRKVPMSDPHCGTGCWWCRERKWGFGRLD